MIKNSCVKYFIFITSALFLTGCEWQQPEKQIKQTSQEYAEAFNHKNLEKVMALWEANGVYENLSTEESVEGQIELADYFQKQFDNEATITLTVNEVHIDDSTRAFEKGIIEVSGKEGEKEKNAFKADLIKEQGIWLIKKLSIVALSTVNSHFEQLSELNWLVGEWIDNDDTVNFTSRYAWDKNKNFLTQHFSMAVLDQETIKGQQIIGWDPYLQSIRSWIFDSSGGFGESLWSKQDNQWYAETSYTLPDGGKASATHIYAEVDPNNYTFSSEGRDIDGTVLPNIGPFNVIRVNSSAKK